ncbi:hypothetical protein [Streptomyces tirandamycinicus]|uniref:Uncharacterized protein n=1 Tax=Streptomyces tirandamycinicus TaxID=2174846 RepID=A0A2S1T1V9_9ACTN|nr:hypothetical protein [Streptomyces tirandamycinicus]AWI32649.1 hypothetical protein DDW44_30485 [Streptomyces tirandamycinicus]
MSTMTSTVPAVQPAMFPPPSVPLLFADGDRYVWTHTGDVWTRTNGSWVPSRYDGLNDGQDDGTGWWSDAQVSAALGRAIANWDVRQRFVPAAPGPALPGRTLLALPPMRDSAQYVTEHQGSGLLVPLRDLVAQHDEDAAYDVPGVIPGDRMRDVVMEVVSQQRRPRATYDEAAGRVYVRYDLPVDLYGRPAIVECLHVFVLTATPAEA